MKRLLLALSITGICAFAQGPPVNPTVSHVRGVGVPPANTCIQINQLGNTWFDSTTAGDVYTCGTSGWGKPTAGGVTSVIAGTGISVDHATGAVTVTNTSPSTCPTGTDGDLQTKSGANCAAITPGTGVATALAVNVGSTGAPVLFNGALGTPSSGNASNLTGFPASLVAAPCATTITTGTSGTLSTCFTVNQEATAATGVTYALPTAASGLQYCIDSGWNGSAANTGVLTLAASASGQFIVFTDGTLSATGGNVTSGGAARDGACVYGIDSTHWMFLPHSGTWTKH